MKASNRCPVCSTALGANPEEPIGQLKCPRCFAELWFWNTDERTVFVVRGSEDPIARFMENVPFQGDSLDMVELVMEIEELEQGGKL